MTTKKSIILYTSWRSSIEKLSAEETKLFLEKLFEKHLGESETEIPNEMVRLDMFWDSIQYLLNDSIKKYENKVKGAEKSRSKIGINTDINKTETDINNNQTDINENMTDIRENNTDINNKNTDINIDLDRFNLISDNISSPKDKDKVKVKDKVKDNDNEKVNDKDNDKEKVNVELSIKEKEEILISKGHYYKSSKLPDWIDSRDEFIEFLFESKFLK